MTRDEAIAKYRAARTAYYEAVERENAAFARYFHKRTHGIPTNGAQVSRLSNETNYRSAELYCAQGYVWKFDIDPWDLDDEDGVERTPVGY